MRLLVLLLSQLSPPPPPPTLLVTAVARAEVALTTAADRVQTLRATERARLTLSPIVGAINGVSFRIEVP